MMFVLTVGLRSGVVGVHVMLDVAVDGLNEKVNKKEKGKVDWVS